MARLNLNTSVENFPVWLSVANGKLSDPANGPFKTSETMRHAIDNMNGFDIPDEQVGALHDEVLAIRNLAGSLSGLTVGDPLAGPMQGGGDMEHHCGADEGFGDGEEVDAAEHLVHDYACFLSQPVPAGLKPLPQLSARDVALLCMAVGAAGALLYRR